MPIINDPNQPQPPQQQGPVQANQSPLGRKTQGTGFTNLSKVLGANVRSNIGQTFGSALGRNIQGQQQQFGKVRSQFQQGAAQNTLDTEQNKQLRQQQLQGLVAPGQVSTAETTGTYNVSPEIAETFAKFRGGQYTGPKELEGSGALMAQGQQLQGLGQQFGTQAGRFGLLKQTIARGPYAQGQQRLDDLLLSSQRQAVKPTIQQGVQAGQQIQQGTKAAELQAQELAGRAQQFGEETGKQLQETAGSNIQYLQNVAKQAEAEKAARIKSIQDQIAAGTGDVELDEATAKELGIVGGEDAWTDIGQAITASANKANVENVASAADYARLKALEQLGGANTQSYLGSQGFNTQAQDQARKFYEKQLAYDKDMAATLAANRKAAFMQEQGGNLQGLVDTIRDLQAARQLSASDDYQPMWGGKSARELNKILEDRKNQIQASAAAQGIRWVGDKAVSDLYSRNLTDTPYYQGVRENAINEFLRDNAYSTAARRFKIKPQTPPVTS